MLSLITFCCALVTQRNKSGCLGDAVVSADGVIVPWHWEDFELVSGLTEVRPEAVFLRLRRCARLSTPMAW